MYQWFTNRRSCAHIYTCMPTWNYFPAAVSGRNKAQCMPTDRKLGAVQELLSGRPKKLLMSVDELSLLLNGIDRYSAGKMNSNRAAWLQLYEGGNFTVD